MSAPIEVIEVRRYEGGGSLKAFAKVKVGCFILHGVKLIQQDGQRPWCALPQTPGRKKADGSGAGWFPVIECTNKAVMDQIRDAVIEAWERDQ